MRTQELTSSSVTSEDKTTTLVGPKIMQNIKVHNRWVETRPIRGSRSRCAKIAWIYAAPFRAQHLPKSAKHGEWPAQMSPIGKGHSSVVTTCLISYITQKHMHTSECVTKENTSNKHRWAGAILRPRITKTCNNYGQIVISQDSENQPIWGW